MSTIDDKIGLSSKNRGRLLHIRNIVSDRWRNARLLPYPPHDGSHCEKIEKLLELLLLDDEESKKAVDNTFTDDEKFLLLAAVWLHDIGMCPNLTILPNLPNEELRRIHHKRSADFVKRESELGLAPAECERLSTICFLHRRSERIPEMMDDKTRLIIAYIRLADALHIPDRAPLRELRTFLAYGMDPISKYHWFKSFYVIDAKPSKKERWKLIVKFKKPINYNGDAEKDLRPLIEIIKTELEDEVDSVKNVLVAGKLKYNLPAYTEVEPEFEVAYLTNDEIAELKELLGIIELFNPTISPNSGKVIDIVLKQIERCVTVERPENAEKGIQSLRTYLNHTLVPLLRERSCHAYLWNIHDELQIKFDDLNTQLNTVNNPNASATIRIKWLSEIQLIVRALMWWREELRKKLPEQVLKAGIINRHDSLLLYGYSSSVILTLDALDEDIKKNIEVFVLEGSTKTKHRYDNKLIYCDGMQYLRELKRIGIKNIYFVPDLCASNLFLNNKPEKRCKRVTKVFFGANGIDKCTGEVFHSLGHLAIADMAKAYNIPVYVIAEGLKIRKNLPKTPENQRKGPWYPTDVKFNDIIKNEDIRFYNPHEDIVPREKITEIITEKGIYNSNSSIDELNKISTEIGEVIETYKNRFVS